MTIELIITIYLLGNILFTSIFLTLASYNKVDDSLLNLIIIILWPITFPAFILSVLTTLIIETFKHIIGR